MGWGHFFLPYKPSENTEKHKDVLHTQTGFSIDSVNSEHGDYTAAACVGRRGSFVTAHEESGTNY